MKKALIITAIVAGIAFAASRCSLPWINKINPADENTWNWSAGFTDEIAAKYKEIGRKVLKTSFLTLNGEVTNAMKEGGVQHAVRYCNLKAYPLIDSLSEHYKVSIKRVALKYRNPDNTMRPYEQELFMDYDARNKQKESIMDKVVLSSDNYLEYYAPIILTTACLACHGSPGTDIKDVDYQLIRTLYPEDKATGFVPGDLRGMWRIRFMPEQPK
jgi:hypothetical protein